MNTGAQVDSPCSSDENITASCCLPFMTAAAERDTSFSMDISCNTAIFASIVLVFKQQNHGYGMSL